MHIVATQSHENLQAGEADPALDAIFACRFVNVSEGIRVAVKDVIDIAGVPTKAGSRALEDAAPARKDAAVVAQIRKSDCRLVGKTQLHELAYGVTGLNGWTGTPVNPAYPTLIPGGSSSGSAVAVAMGLCDFALGTDTGGSVRVPAACCGIFGLKTTFGRISRRGLTPARSSLDCVGPLASTPTLLDTAMAAMDPSWGPLPPVKSAHIGLIEADAEADILAAVTGAARLLDPDVAPLKLVGMKAANDAGLTIIARETYAAFSALLGTGKVGADVAGRLARAKDITDQMLADAEAVRATFTLAVDRALESVDALVLPTLPIFPPWVADANNLIAALNITALVRPFNLSGHPAVSIPLDPINRRPCSLQLVGRKGDDERLVALAAEYLRRSEKNPDRC
ncbi:MAG TPA: amidase [Sneathiellales bacterium]|nr:amidase [Sneathiellales bacterium]